MHGCTELSYYQLFAAQTCPGMRLPTSLKKEWDLQFTEPLGRTVWKLIELFSINKVSLV
jgi:hypothetical protein